MNIIGSLTILVLTVTCLFFILIEGAIGSEYDLKSSSGITTNSNVEIVKGGVSSHNKFEPQANEVFIGHSCVGVPLSTILLARKDDRNYAILFNKAWTENSGENKYASYTVFNVDGCVGSSTCENISGEEFTASDLPLTGPFRPFLFNPGKPYVILGDNKLTWFYKGLVCLNPPDKIRGEYGYELAPTPWKEIQQVDISDKRIIWYKQDDNRARAFVPIASLW